MKIGAKIRKAREEKDLSLRDFSLLLLKKGRDLTPETLGNYERDETSVPADLMPQIADVLGKKVGDFF